MSLLSVKEYKRCNIAIWLFFFLLIFEGAFRKWFLPSLSDIFLVTRDPLAIYLVWMACKRGLWKNPFVRISWGIAFITLITTLLFGHQNLLVALYGVRIWVYYIPLIFAIPWFMNWDDVMLMCKCTLYITMKAVPDSLVWMIISAPPEPSLSHMGLHCIWYGRAAAFLPVFSLIGSGESASFESVHIFCGHRLSVG